MRNTTLSPRKKLLYACVSWMKRYPRANGTWEDTDIWGVIEGRSHEHGYAVGQYVRNLNPEGNKGQRKTCQRLVNDIRRQYDFEIKIQSRPLTRAQLFAPLLKVSV